MNIVLVTAGGIGSRMHMDIPKQFLNIKDKPVIIYTLEAFQKHPNIDAICVVCLKGWKEILKAYAKQFNITKLKWIVDGGENGQASIKNGLDRLEQEFNKQDIILIHDGNRPLVTQETISDCIIKCQQYGSGIAVVPCNTAILEKKDKDNQYSKCALDRDLLVITQTPHAFRLETLLCAHKEAAKQNITNSVASCTLMIELGKTVHFAAGSETNIKITNADDLKIFKALLKIDKNKK